MKIRRGSRDSLRIDVPNTNRRTGGLCLTECCDRMVNAAPARAINPRLGASRVKLWLIEGLRLPAGRMAAKTLGPPDRGEAQKGHDGASRGQGERRRVGKALGDKG